MIRNGLPVLLFLCCIAPAAAVGPPPSGDELPTGATLRLGTRKLRHGGLVRAVAFAPDGRRLASASHDQTVSVWSVPGGRELFRCTGHQADVRCVAFSPDGELLASGGADATVRLWAARGPGAGRLVHTFSLKGDAVEALAFAPRGRLLACGADDGTIHLLDPSKRQTIRALTQDRGVRCLAWSSDGQVLASNGASKAVTIWAPDKGTVLRAFGEEPVAALAFAPKGRHLVTWEEGSTLRLWDADSGKSPKHWSASDDTGRGGAGSQIYQLAFSRDGASVLCGTLGGAIERFDPRTGKRLARWAAHTGRVTALAVGASGIASAGADHAVRLWSAKGKPLGPEETGPGPIVSLSVVGDRIAVAQQDGRVRLWSLQGRQAKPLPAPKATALQVAFRPDGLLFLAGADRLRTFDRKGRLTERPVAASPITGLALSGDGTRLATTHRDGSVTVADSDGKKAATSPNRERRILPAMSPDGARVAGFGPLAFVPLWEGQSAEPLASLTGHRGGALAAAFSPDGRALLTGGRDQRAAIWDLWTGSARREDLKHPAYVCAVAWSPAGTVATADVTGAVRVWSIGTGKLLTEWKGHRGPVTGLAFADKGRSLVSAGLDATLLVWTVPAVPEPRPKGKALAEDRRKELWKALLATDAREARQAMATLASDAAKTIALIRAEVRPPDSKAIAKLIEQIDDEQLAVRDKAFKELTRLGSYARAALKQTLTKKPSIEKVKTIDKLLEQIPDDRPTGERLRALRAVELLEVIGSKEARAALTALTKLNNDELTREARAALRRLGAGK